MKKLLIGLLIIAAGTAAFFLFRNKKETIVTDELTKEWILGKWKPGERNDSNFSRFQFDFKKDGNVVRSIKDSSITDTSYYEWNKANELVWKEKASDSTGKVYLVSKLTLDSLMIQAVDSSTILLIKMK
ncbi:MAG: hypothetical protein WBC06_03815 [Chitinophagaceae bacterium]